jgi:hypothetical protein
MSLDRATGLRRLLTSGTVPASLLSIPGVVGTGFSEKVRRGQRAGEVALTVYVREKRAASGVPVREQIPAWVDFDGLRVPTDVVQVNAPTRPLTLPPALSRESLPGRAAPGVLINARGEPYGSFGCLVTDARDGTTLILTASRAVARWGQLPIGTEVVTQMVSIENPPLEDVVIGHLERVWELITYPRLYPVDGTPLTNAFDGALVRPAAGVTVSDVPINPAMPTGSDTFNLLGIIVGHEEVDQTGTSCYVVCPIGAAMEGLGVVPYGSTVTREARLGETVFFIGSSSSIAEASVAAVNASVGVGLEHPDTPHVAVIGPSFLIEARSATEINIGAAVYAWGGGGPGGSGGVRSRCVECMIALDLDETYDLDLVQDVELADWVRDQYLMRTYTGAILVQLFYRNESDFRARMTGVEPTDSERRYAELLYDKYSAIARQERDGDVLTYIPVTSELVNDVTAALYGLSRFMSQEEYLACHQLLELLAEVRDLSVSDCMAYMNQKANADRILAIIQSVPGWDFSYDHS